MDDPRDKEYLTLAARAVSDRIPDNHGFLLLVTPNTNDGEERVHYISTLSRKDAVNLIKEFLIRCGALEDWCKHIE
jgi:hypothetical protein